MLEFRGSGSRTSFGGTNPADFSGPVQANGRHWMIPSTWRANGVTNPWDTNGPRYRLDADGRPARDGKLGDPDPYNWRRWIGLNPISKGEASRLAMAVVVEAMGELKRLYPGIRTHFISYRVASWGDTDFSSEDLAAFEYDLQQAGIMPLPLEAIIPGTVSATMFWT
jgi:hypothetical protein